MGFINSIGNAVSVGLARLADDIAPDVSQTLRDVAGDLVGYKNISVFGSASSSNPFNVGLGSNLPFGSFMGPLASDTLGGTPLSMGDVASQLRALLGNTSSVMLENGTTLNLPGLQNLGLGSTAFAAQAAQLAALNAAALTNAAGGARLDAYLQKAGLSPAEIDAIKKDPEKSAMYKLQAQQEDLQRFNEIMQQTSQSMQVRHDTAKSILGNIRV